MPACSSSFTSTSGLPRREACDVRFRLEKTFDFEAAHSLPGFPEGHKCRRLHGHSFRVDVVVEGSLPAGSAHLIDYGDISRVVRPIIDGELDHRHLNDIAGLENPTSEMIALWLWRRIRPELPLLAAIVVHETCSSRCIYQGDSA